ncbi:hypothetical protein DE146DRAFT_9783 [Phaeosphaeria sp. MPI-PUGE-AT-0046c]|nr:hypothetical protein DE146DRAFT_9783 [Phaeosphaeria sp. MPI-PUGE-AT-0046c]
MAGSPVRAPRRYTTACRGTTIPAEQASIFFALPPELRLEVYKILLEDCLEHGFIIDFSGLFLCCRQVHQEIRSEFILAAVPLLNAKSTWETLANYPLVLGMRILPKLNSKKAELSIRLPVGPAFGNNPMMANKENKLWVASPCMREVFARNWSTLTLKLDKVI